MDERLFLDDVREARLGFSLFPDHVDVVKSIFFSYFRILKRDLDRYALLLPFEFASEVTSSTLC